MNDPSTYALLAKKIRAAADPRDMQDTIDRHYNNGTLTVSEYGRLDVLIMECNAARDCRYIEYSPYSDPSNAMKSTSIPTPASPAKNVRPVNGSVRAAIAAAVASSEPGKTRVRALKAVRWVLRSGSLYVGPVSPDTLECPLVPSVDQAQVFDGRDNEDLKRRFFASLFGAPFEAELVGCAPAGS